MRLVLDTNTVISGLVWYGTPLAVILFARTPPNTLFTSDPLIAELENVLHRAKFSPRMSRLNVTPGMILERYLANVQIVEPANIPPTILADPSDDHVLACAVAAEADVIVSGDAHLLALGEFRGIPIRSASAFLEAIRTGDSNGR